MPYNSHLNSFEDLVMPYDETRAGFIYLALEKNRKATPFVEEAKALKVVAERATHPKDLLDFREIQPSLLTAAGVSDKARNHLGDKDKRKAEHFFKEAADFGIKRAQQHYERLEKQNRGFFRR